MIVNQQDPPGYSSTPNSVPNGVATVTVLLVDDHHIWRGGVSAILQSTEFKVVGEAGSGEEAVEKVRDLRPDLVLLDIRMSGGDGLEALEKIKAEMPSTKVIMLTTYENPTYMARAVSAGAAGYLLKGIPFDELVTSLRLVADGDSLLKKDELVYMLRSVSPNDRAARELIQPLSVREVEVLRLLSTGLNNREIGKLLFISDSTVKSHVEHIIQKVGVSDRVQAAVWAARLGIV
jgi:DNA-binding NarL/FixJ family response regulator